MINNNISDTSELLLTALVNELKANKNLDSTIVYYDLSNFKPTISVNEAKICLCYLQDFGYVQGVEGDNNLNQIRTKIHGSAIKLVEEKSKQNNYNAK